MPGGNGETGAIKRLIGCACSEKTGELRRRAIGLAIMFFADPGD
jgi:hypothetical protein